MKTIHFGLRVSDLDRFVDFYQRFGYLEFARDEPGDGRTIVMLYLPGEDRVTLELVADPRTPYEFGNAFSHFVVQVDDLRAITHELSAKGIETGPIESFGEGEEWWGFAFTHDPDGFEIELVQWPAGHPSDGIPLEGFGD